MKSPRRRNFEAGILTDAPALVAPAVAQFDDLWIGTPCETCGRTDYCTDRPEG